VSGTDGAIGSRFIQMTLASITANQYVGGKIIITGATGIGYTYDIKSNTATNDPVTGDIRIGLQQPLQVALAADSDVQIVGSPYHDLEDATTTDACVVGVTCSTVVVATAPFAWIQTKGIVGILQDVNVAVIGGVATLSNITAGAVTLMGGNSTYATYYGKNPIIGLYTDVGDSAGYIGVKINLE